MKLRLSRPVMTLLAPLSLAAISLPAVAQNTGAAGGGVYAGLGTTGLVVGYGQTYSPAFGSRLEAAGWSNINRNLTEGGIDYRGSLRMRRAGAALDWHPFANGFRLSAACRGWMPTSTLMRRRLPDRPSRWVTRQPFPSTRQQTA